MIDTCAYIWITSKQSNLKACRKSHHRPNRELGRMAREIDRLARTHRSFVGVMRSPRSFLLWFDAKSDRFYFLRVTYTRGKIIHLIGLSGDAEDAYAVAYLAITDPNFCRFQTDLEQTWKRMTEALAGCAYARPENDAVSRDIFYLTRSVPEGSIAISTPHDPLGACSVAEGVVKRRVPVLLAAGVDPDQIQQEDWYDNRLLRKLFRATHLVLVPSKDSYEWRRIGTLSKEPVADQVERWVAQRSGPLARASALLLLGTAAYAYLSGERDLLSVALALPMHIFFGGVAPVLFLYKRRRIDSPIMEAVRRANGWKSMARLAISYTMIAAATAFVVLGAAVFPIWGSALADVFERVAMIEAVVFFLIVYLSMMR